MKIVVTGGCGFIGSNFVELCLKKRKDVKIINVDSLTTGSNQKTLRGLKHPNYKFVKGNICDKKLMEKLIEDAKIIINFAAESHVDRSIANSTNFLKSNIQGVHVILEILRKRKNVKFLQISTDEVYGEVLRGKANENRGINPSNPYSATKASAEMFIKSYARTYDLDTIITRSSNNYGPRQFPEKLIPKAILSALKNVSIPIHGNGSSKRQWIHVFDNCDAILKIIDNWKSGSIYNIGGHYEDTNLNVVKKILKLIDKSDNLISFVKDRPGQDKRYAINSCLIENELGFITKISFEKGLESTIQWYLKNKNWWQNLVFKKIKNPTPWLN